MKYIIILTIVSIVLAKSIGSERTTKQKTWASTLRRFKGKAFSFVKNLLHKDISDTFDFRT